ncbi:MAG: aromatic amino acid exporter YddG [Bosea sp. (in: a-proteobacteria)]
MSRPTLLGLGAILLWGLLALLTDMTKGVPPFLLTALTFWVASAFGLIVLVARGQLGAMRQSPAAWVLGVGGLFGSHALYFAAMKNAPAAEASLIGYLWPLLIVLMSGFLPGERLRWPHVAGACLGLTGIIVLTFGKGGIGGAASLPLFGYTLALLFALVWAGYSVLSRRMATVPTEAVVGFCIATAVLASLTHVVVEPAMWPSEGNQWLGIILLGIGPTGAAFFLWDIGMKHGDIRLLGTASYAAPVISTVALVLAGRAEAGWSLAIACALIVAGALVATKLSPAR